MTTSFGPYRLLRRIAHGGMGEVYLAVLERSGGFSKTVALKMMLPTVAAKPELAGLFESEASVAAMLNHPNIVQIFDHGSIDQKTFITMEFVEGPDLSALIDRHPGPFPPEVALEIMVQLCRGLSHAHERKDLHGRPVGIVHGDVSPPNILISKDGQAKLADFGLARVRTLAAQEGLITGKYSYMSPEQARGQTLTEKSDLYSLGLVLYELLTATRAFPLKATPTKTLEALCQAACTPIDELRPDLPPEICEVVNRSLSPSPDNRFETASAMSAALTKAQTPTGPEGLSSFVKELAPEPSIAPDPTEMAAIPVAPKKPSRRWLIWAAALFVIAWSSSLAWWQFHTPPTKPEPPPAPTTPKASVLVEPEPAPAPAPKPKPKKKLVPAPAPAPVPAPLPPKVSLVVPNNFTARLDHKQINSSTLSITDRTPHLIRLRPKNSDRPEVTLRLSPPPDPGGNWTAAIHTTPWMQIKLNKRPAGQTPKSKLPLPRGPFTLLLKRDDISIPLSLEIPE